MSKQSERHVPVLLKDAIEFLNVRAGGTIADCTLGLAGHASEIARRLGSGGHLIGFDRDPEALALAKARLDQVVEELGGDAPRITLIGEAFSSIAGHVAPASLDGLLADFGGEQGKEAGDDDDEPDGEHAEGPRSGGDIGECGARGKEHAENAGNQPFGRGFRRR